jgi:hypothetical protein
LHDQVAKPYAFLNFGDPELAPYSDWDVRSKDDYQHNADQFQKVGTAIEVLRRGGVQFRDEEELRMFVRKNFGLEEMPAIEFKEPVSSGGMGGGK